MLEPNSHAQVSHTRQCTQKKKELNTTTNMLKEKTAGSYSHVCPLFLLRAHQESVKLRALSAWRLGTLRRLTHAALTKGTVIMSSHGRRSLFLANGVRRVSQSPLEPLERLANVRADHPVLWRQHVALCPVHHLFGCSHVRHW